MNVSEMQGALSALMKARATGIRKATYQGRSMEYGSDAEMASAISDLERRIAASQPIPVARRRFLYTSSSKGL